MLRHHRQTRRPILAEKSFSLGTLRSLPPRDQPVRRGGAAPRCTHALVHSPTVASSPSRSPGCHVASAGVKGRIGGCNRIPRCPPPPLPPHTCSHRRCFGGLGLRSEDLIREEIPGVKEVRVLPASALIVVHLELGRVEVHGDACGACGGFQRSNTLINQTSNTPSNQAPRRRRHTAG